MKGNNRNLLVTKAVLLVVTAALPGCLYYDSTWGQGAAEQKRAVARLKPGTLERSPRERTDARVLHVRAHATRAYVSETLDWRVRFESLLGDARSVLEPTLGITLESGGTSTWEPPNGETNLDDTLSALADEDTGDGVDFVVGFVQSTPKLVTDFHKLGIGRPFSKYLVVRAANDPAELDSLSKNFDEVDSAKKNRLYAERKHHKEVAVFLHEIAHTLGAIHRLAPVSFMNPVYDSKASGFDEATLKLLRIAVAGRFGETSRDAAYRKLADFLQASPEGFVESERLAEIQSLSAAMPLVASRTASASASAPSANSAAGPAPTEPPVGLDTLPKRDRQRYDEALTLEKTDVHAAWSTAAPLFESAKRVLPVQQLRCRLAKELKFFAGVVEAHCARFEALKAAAN